MLPERVLTGLARAYGIARSRHWFLSARPLILPQTDQSEQTNEPAHEGADNKLK